LQYGSAELIDIDKTFVLSKGTAEKLSSDV
jgi:hypothetical protein